MPDTGLVIDLPPADRRRRLAESVAHMGVAIATGEVTPSRIELQVLALICDESQLPFEAARVRRWIAYGAGR